MQHGQQDQGTRPRRKHSGHSKLVIFLAAMVGSDSLIVSKTGHGVVSFFLKPLNGPRVMMA